MLGFFLAYKLYRLINKPLTINLYNYESKCRFPEKIKK